ncbi:MAG: GNAT family N-acetyltransferase [Bacilli bacterium]|nr:GNAT family N-acetyltransferase [Bacilli bacterium]
MNSFVYKRISKEDDMQVRDLIKRVYKNIENKDFFILWTEEQMDRFFDENYSILFGAYDANKLIAMVQIFMPPEVESEYYDILDIKKPDSMCELGGFLVYEEYRQKGIMSELSKAAMDYFSTLNYEYIISTIHPNNIASRKVVSKLGFEYIKDLTTQSGFLRSLYFKENQKTSV